MVLLKDLAHLLEKIERLSSKEEKVLKLASFIKNLEPNEIKIALWLTLGNVAEEWKEREINISVRTIIEVLTELGYNKNEIIKMYKITGDLGNAVKIMFKKGKKIKTLFSFENKKLSLQDFYRELKKLSEIKGYGSREKKKILLKALYLRLDPIEAKFLTRIIQGDMRYGISEGLLEEVISKAFSIPLDLVQRAHMILADIGIVGKIAKEKGYEGIKNVKIKIFNPVKPMLAEKVDNVYEALQEHGILAFEFKFDGIRAQIHKKRNRVKIFTRRLKEVTNSFPEVIESVKNLKAEEVIVEGEIVAWDFKKNLPMPFQYLVTRIKRKEEKDKYMKEIPVKLFLFDILYFNGKMLIDEPYEKRRKILENISNGIELVPRIITSDPKEASKFFEKSVKMGNEGLVAKVLDSKYIPGKRKRLWLKIKSTMEPLDLVIVGAEWGHGRRKNLLSDLYLAVRDEKTGRFYIVTKTFKGLSDKEYEELTKELLKLKIREEGRVVWVKPKIVVETVYDEIQKSPKYECGFALRFARVSKIRWDKSEKDADTLDRIKYLYELQQKKKSFKYSI